MNILNALTVIIIFLSGFCRAEIHVVTHRDNPVHSISENQLRDLYLARSQTIENGVNATIYEGGGDELRARFIRLALGMRVRQFDAYWARLVFAGRMLPLNKTNKESELFTQLENNIHAIGYTDRAPQSQTLKTLLVINE
ncbi:MAG: hypothetical protein JXR16_03755 [Bermanella sp.]